MNNSSPKKIHEFSEKLLSSVQALESMGNKRTNNDWQDWKFSQLVEALENRTCRNPKSLNHKPLSEGNRANTYRNPNKVIMQINIKLNVCTAKNLTIRQQIVKQ